MLVEITMEAGRQFRQEVPAHYRGFLYVLEGAATIGGRRVSAPEVAWFEPTGRAEDAIDTIALTAETPFRGLLFAGTPIDEPVVAYGPFVMNTREEIVQAFADYEANRLTG